MGLPLCGGYHFPFSLDARVDMAEKQSLKVERRTLSGKWAVRRLRAQGIVPGVLYGHGEPALSVQLPARELVGLVRRGTRVVELTSEGPPETALIRDLQWDTLGNDILHVDFARITADERIKIEVQIELSDTAPVVEESGVLSQLMHTIEIECVATEIPEEIRVDVRGLHLDQAIHVSELVAPPGVKLLADADIVVVHVTKKLEEP